MKAKRPAPEDRELLRRARAAARRAHAPYSHRRVGAAVRTARGGIHVGANVENASYGLTVCAERHAVAAAVAAEGPGMRLVAVAVVVEGPEAFPPCGACRQVLAEFARGDVTVLYRATAGAPVVTSLRALLPSAFRL